ncbi:unnamed protein product, partial [Prorocentrum cordatum]
AVAAAVAAALRAAWALLAGAGSEEDAELAMRWQVMQPETRQQVRGAPPRGEARARRNVGAHVGLGKGVDALRQAMARPQHAQRGGRCGPRKKQAASEDHIVGDPEAREMEGDTSAGIGGPDMDECKGTDHVVGAPEGQVNDKEGATKVISQAGAALRVGCLDVHGAEMQATDGPVEVAPLSEDAVRGQTAAEEEVVRGRRGAPPRAASVCAAARGKGAAAPRAGARASSADLRASCARGGGSRGWRFDLAQAARLAGPAVPLPLASGPRWWKQGVGEVSAKVHKDPLRQGRLSSTGADEEEESIEAQRRAQVSRVDELAKMLAFRAQELTAALRCGAAGAVDDAKARLRAAVDQRPQAAAQ